MLLVNIPDLAIDDWCAVDLFGPFRSFTCQETQLIVGIRRWKVFSHRKVLTWDKKTSHISRVLDEIIEIGPQFRSYQFVGINYQHPVARSRLYGKIPCWLADIIVSFGKDHNLTSVLLCNLERIVGRLHVADNDFVEVFHRLEHSRQILLGIVCINNNGNILLHIKIK